MKFGVGDRVRYYNDDGEGIIISKTATSGMFLVQVQWDNGNTLPHYDSFLVLLSSSDYTDFLEKIKERMGIL
jgi:hypothetical protein